MSLVARPLGDSIMLNDMLVNAPKFDEPIVKSAWATGSSTREVMPGPRSPPPVRHKLPNGYESHDHPQGGSSTKQNGHDRHLAEQAGPSAGATIQSSSSLSQIKSTPPTLQITSSSTLRTPPSSSHKGKQKESISSPAHAPSSCVPVTPRAAQRTDGQLYDGHIRLTWPSRIAAQTCAVGLFNPSMACYANATLQVLLHTPPVLHMALCHDSDSCLQRKKKNFCMLCVLKKLVEVEHWSGKRKAYSPRDVHQNLSVIKKGFSKNRQEDTHEFFRFVTDALQNSALIGQPEDLQTKIKHSTWVYQTWGGEVRSRVVCMRCKKPSDTFDSFLDLSLDVNKTGQKTVESMLQGFIRDDKLEGDNKYHCEFCKGKVNATKSFRIAQAPPVLTLHLKRFSVNFNSYSGRARADKFTDFISYSEKLDISEYMVDTDTPGTTYRLFGVTCHRGVELRYGHYTSYVKSPQDKWYHADDDDMEPVDRAQVLREKSAYLLSYIRVGSDERNSTKSPRTQSQANGHTSSDTALAMSDLPSLPSSPPSKRKRESDSETSTMSPRKVSRLTPSSLENKSTATARPSSHPPSTDTSLRGPSTPQPDEAESEPESDQSVDAELFPNKFTSTKSKHPLMNGHGKSANENHIHAPKPYHAASTQPSPIQRTAHPPPRTPDSGSKQLSRKQQRKMMKNPFNVGNSTYHKAGDRGLANLSRGQAKRMGMKGAKA